MITKHFLVFFLLGIKLFGQNSKLDSLLKILPKSKADTNLVNLYLRIGDEYVENRPSDAKDYYKKAEKLSTKIDFQKGLFKFITSYVYILNHEGLYDSSIILNLKSIEIAKGLNSQVFLGTAFVNTGIVYSAKANYDKAMNYYLEGQKIFLKIGNKTSEAAIDDMLQLHFYNLGQYKRAIQFGENAVSKSRKLANLNLLGRSLNNLGLSYLATNNYEKAKKAFIETLEIGKKINNENFLLNEYFNLGDVYRSNGEYEKMRESVEKGLILSKKMEFYEKETVGNNMLGDYYFAKGNYKLAKEYLENALEFSYKYDYKTLRSKILLSLSQVYFSEKNYKEGKRYENMATILDDSLFNETIQKNTIELQTKYETEKKETQIKLQSTQLKQKTTNNILLIGGLATLAILSLLGFFNYRNRQRIDQQKIKELEQEKQLTAVSSIMQGQEEERSRMAKDLHDGLGGILSGIKLNLSAMRGNQIMQEADANIFSRSISQLDSAIQEMRRVAHNLMPEALLKFGLDEAIKDFCDGINQASTVKLKYSHFGEAIPNDQSLQVILYRIIQELSNNAIKYAHANTILIQLTKHETGISLTVEDDGKGFNVSDLDKNKGAGINNVISRVNYLKGTFTIDSEIGKGTSCFVEIPI